MSELLISSELEVNIPEKPLELAKWLHGFGFSEDVTNIIKENNVNGETFRTLTEKDMKDLFPVFMQRKKLRDWAHDFESGLLVETDEDNDKDISNLSDNPEGIEVASSNEEEEDGGGEIDVDSGTQSLSLKEKKRLTSTTPTVGPPAKKRRTDQIEIKNSLESSSVSMGEDVQNDIVTLAKKLKVVVPESVKYCRSKKELLSRKARVDVIKTNLIVLQAAIGRNKPTQSEFELCAQQIVQLIPEMKDPVPPIRQDAFKPWNTVVMLLKKAYYNRKPVENPHKKAGPDAAQETDSTAEGHDQQLVKEMSKKKPDAKKLFGLLKVSFDHRRKWINKLQGKGTVKKILDQYPGFKSFPQVMMETALVTGCKEYKEAWAKLLPAMWQCVQTHFPNVLEAYTEEELAEIDDDDKTLFVLYCLPQAWGLPEKTTFAHFIEENVNFEEFVKKLDGDCHLIIQNRDDVPQCFVAIENQIVVETDNYINALLSFFGVHQVFNLQYPQKLQLCFKFLEEFVFGEPQKRKTQQYRNGILKLLSC